MENIEPSNNAAVDPAMTPKEVREMVTPYAFGVADELIGTPLASPFRRGVALALDLILVALLTTVNSLILAGLSAWAFWRAGNKLQQSQRFGFFRKVLRLFVAILVFVVAIGIFEMINNGFSDQDKGITLQAEGIEVAALSVKYLMRVKRTAEQIESGQCLPALSCWQPVMQDLTDDLASLEIDSETADKLMKETVKELPNGLTAQQKATLLDNMRIRYAQNDVPETDASPPDPQSVTSPVSQSAQNNLPEPDQTETEEQPITPGILAWLESMASDLGLGFGWAAFYFTVFTAWWQGQTPGKKAMSIKVVKLDGKTMNLWESFGRYGGYGAGLATGLLGFLQIYWDPNRQAIQDKISETLVIKTGVQKQKASP